MKPNLALIGMVALALGACDKKEAVSQTGTQPENKASGPETRSSSVKPVRPKPNAGVESATTQTTTDGTEVISQPPPAIAPAPSPAPVKELSETEKVTEQLRQERLARMAKAREERTVQMTQQMTDSFKQQDANADGFLAKDEMDGRMQRRFTEADKNGDGFLDSAEQQAMIQAAAQRMSEGGAGRRGSGQGGGFAGGQDRGNRNQ